MVGHVVAAVAAQAQATDDDSAQIALHCTFVCNRLSIDYYRLFVIYFPPGFFFPFLSFLLSFIFCIIYSAALCFDPLFSFFVRFLKSVVFRPLVLLRPSPPLSLIFCVCKHLSLSGARRMHSPASYLSALFIYLCP